MSAVTKQPNLQELAESLVAYGRKQGASEMEISIGTGSEFSVKVFNGEVESLTESGSKSLNMRVFVDGKKANASSSDFTLSTLHSMVDNAITRARLGGKDAFAGLPDNEPVAKGDLKLFDPAVLAMEPEKKIAFARELEAIGLKDKRIKKSSGASFGTYEGTSILVNSKGFSNSYRKSSASAGVSFMAGEGDNLQQDGWYDGSIHLNGLWSAERIAKMAAERTARLVGSRKVETQKVPLIVDPQMAAMLLGFLSQCISGSSVTRRQTYLADKLGQKIGNELVTIIDDPLMPGQVASRPFDSEGVASKKHTFVDQGVLKGFVLNTYFGRKLKMPSTGHAGGLTNFYWAAGKSTPEEIIKSVDKGLYLTGVMGQGTVPTTGDISLGAVGLWIEKGAIAFPVSEITIAGNLADLLMNVEMVGNDLEIRQGISAPTLKFKEITVGGTNPKG